jgi:NitT/TauT family transport system substrate-binding protein
LAPLLYNDGYRNSDILKHYGKSYTVKALKFRGSTPQITALAAGELNIAQLSFSSFAMAIENAKLHDIRVIADIFQDGYKDYLTQRYMVHGNSNIRSVADLKGKTLGVNAFGGGNDIALRIMMRRHGLKLNRDYTAIEVRFGTMVSFLGEGKIDLIGMGMPFRAMAERGYKARSLFSVKDAVGVSQLVLLAAQTDFMKKNRSALNDFFEDYVRGSIRRRKSGSSRIALTFESMRI